jgi:hypothetical protein
MCWRGIRLETEGGRWQETEESDDRRHRRPTIGWLRRGFLGSSPGVASGRSMGKISGQTEASPGMRKAQKNASAEAQRWQSTVNTTQGNGQV